MINNTCYDFQQKIIDMFNEQEEIPFILKYYLFKDIWEKIEQTKFKNDYEIRASQKERKTLMAEIPISEEKTEEK